MQLNNITKPAWYYNEGKATVGPLDYAEQQSLGVGEHAVVKYVTRAGRKPGNARLKDLKQAKFYLDWLIEKELAFEQGVVAATPQEYTYRGVGTFDPIEIERRHGPIDRRSCRNPKEAGAKGYRRVSPKGRRKDDLAYELQPLCSGCSVPAAKPKPWR